MRLIDADELISNVFKNDISYNAFKNLVQRQQTVDAVPIKRGEWQIEGMNTYDLAYGCTGYEPIYRCSCCGIITESYLRTEKPIMPEDASFPDYCPNCGASMDGEEQEDEE